MMTLQQEAYSKIDQLSDDGLRALMDMIDTIRFMSVSGFKKTIEEDNTDFNLKGKNETEELELFPDRSIAVFPEEDDDTKKMRLERRKEFMASAGKIDIDEDAIALFRERSKM